MSLLSSILSLIKPAAGPAPAAPVQAPKPAPIDELSAEQKAAYGHLTADNGFSMPAAQARSAKLAVDLDRPSEHFTWAETMVSDTAARLGIDNHWPEAYRERVVFTCQQLEKVRAMLGNRPITVNSMYRGPALNRAIGGAKNSSHMDGWAVDFVCPSFGSTVAVATFIAQNAAAAGLKFDQLIQEDGGWVHLGFDPQMRGQKMTWYSDKKIYVNGIFDRLGYIKACGK